MPRYIAFLRAINVGGHTVKMDRLRALFTALRFANVETFIASGNVIFETRSAGVEALERRIEEQLAQALGYEVTTFLRSPEELAGVVAHQPFGDPASLQPPHTVSIGFLKAAPAASAQRQVSGLRTAVDDFHLHGRELYWSCRARFSESEVTGPVLAKALGAPVTMRKSSTVAALAARYTRDRRSGLDDES